MSTEGRRALVALAILLGAPAPALAQTPPGYEQGPFELFVRRLPERPIVDVLVDSAGVVHIPLSAVLDRAGVPFRVESTPGAAAATLVLEWPPVAWRTTVGLADGVVATAGSTDTIPAAERVLWGGELYLTAAALARLLGADVTVDWPGLVIVVADRAEFPAIARLEVEARRARDRRDAEAAALDAPYPPRTGGFAGGWGGSIMDVAGVRRGSLYGSAAAAVVGGSLEVGSTLAFGTGLPNDFRDRYIRYSRAFPHDRLVRYLEVGNVYSTSAASRRLRGITLSNEPIHTPLHFDDALIAPQVPAGWEYEVYQGDRLVGIAGSGDTGIRTPVQYGRTPVRVRLVGPAGQESMERLVFVVPAEQVPAGAVRWFAGGGDCEDDDDCWDYGYAEARYGISRGLTIGAGADRITFEHLGPSTWHALAFVGASPAPNLNFQVQHRTGTFLLARGQWASGRGTLNADYAWHRPEAGEAISPGWQASLSGAFFPAMLGGRSLNARARLRGAETGVADAWQADVSTALRGAYVSLGWEAGLQGRDMLTFRTHTQPGTFFRRRLADLSLSAAAAFSGAGAELFETAITLRPARAVTMSATLRTRAGLPPTFVIGLVSRLPAGYAQYRVSNAGGATTQYLSADGGAAMQLPSPPLLTTSSGVGQAGVRGRVFHDDDGDGRFGPGDTPAAGAVVSVRGEPVVTDEDGTFRLWRVEPYDAISVAIDSFSIDPGWTPASRRTVVRLTPNLFNSVSLPLVRTRELAGSVRPPADRPDAGGIGIEILDADGTIVVRTRTFRDGEFYVQRIRPGSYTVRVAGASLAALGIDSAVPVAFDVPAAGRDVVRVPVLVIGG